MARVPASETTRKFIEAMISGEAERLDKSELPADDSSPK